MNIFEQINEIANVCESIIDEATLTTPEIRTRIEKQQEIAKKSQEENRPKKAKIEAAKEAIKNVLNSMRTNKDKEAIHCNCLDEKYQNDPEYTIPRGNKKRVQGNIKRYTNRALDRNPDAKQYQKEAVAEFVRMMKAKVGSGRKKLSPEELAAVKRIGQFSPANMDPEESEKYKRALEQKKYYKNLMYQAKNKKK